MRVIKYLAQEHNAVPRPGLEPGPLDPESSALTIRPPTCENSNLAVRFGGVKQKKYRIEVKMLYSSIPQSQIRILILIKIGKFKCVPICLQYI